MTIHEIVNALRLRPADFELTSWDCSYFPPAKCDVLIGEGGRMIVVINRTTGHFAALINETQVIGTETVEYNKAEIADMLNYG